MPSTSKARKRAGEKTGTGMSTQNVECALDPCWRRPHFSLVEVRNISGGQEIGILLQGEVFRPHGPSDMFGFAVSRTEVQKLFDCLWRYDFRPHQEPEVNDDAR